MVTVIHSSALRDAIRVRRTCQYGTKNPTCRYYQHQHTAIFRVYGWNALTLLPLKCKALYVEVELAEVAAFVLQHRSRNKRKIFCSQR